MLMKFQIFKKTGYGHIAAHTNEIMWAVTKLANN